MSVREKIIAPELELVDPRWSLVERIIASPSFAKTERLSSFLVCVCELALGGQNDQINEQYIGTAVFGRSPDYDPGIDSIVRSHASRLRHRLRQYFSEEGASEELLLTIPKGAYLPVFTPRVTSIAIGPISTDSRHVETETMAPVSAFTEPSADSAIPTQLGPHWLPKTATRKRMWLVVAALLLLLAGLATAFWHWNKSRQAKLAAEAVSASTQAFWKSLSNDHEKTIVVGADSGLVLLQGLTKQRVTLASYLNGTYIKNLPLPPDQAKFAVDIGTRRYTSIVDLWIANKILRMPNIVAPNLIFRYARDLRMNEIKQSNLILLGTYESTPWVQLFEPSMNFYFKNELVTGVFSVMNRNPQRGEQPKYDSTNDDPEHTIYGVVAYRPTLNGSGKVLILEGQSMAGTETASDFVFDDAYLLPFLNSIRKPNGSIPYFELLLRSKSISSEASRLEVVAVRVEDQ